MAETPLLKEMGITPEERVQRLRLLGIGDNIHTALIPLLENLRPHLDELVDHWFDRQSSDPATQKLISYAKKRGHLGPGLINQIVTMMEGPYGEEYFESRLRVGMIHERMGVEPSWYMGAWRTVADFIESLLASLKVDAAERIHMLSAMEKVVQLDQVLALDAYFHAKNRILEANNIDLKKLTLELEEKNKILAVQYGMAKEASRIKDEFLSRVSHELRTPLNAIIGYGDLLLDGIDGPVTPEQEKSLQKISRAAQVLLKLIETLIESSRMAAAGVEGRTRFNLVPVVEAEVQKVTDEANRRNLTLTLQAPSAEVQGYGNADAFGSALAQVLNNALKFTESGSVTAKVDQEGESAVVLVSDTGIGVPETDKDKIFEPFHQSDGGDSRKFGGLGMGLTFAMAAMTNMGGELRLLDSSEEGSTFQLRLPLANSTPSGA